MDIQNIKWHLTIFTSMLLAISLILNILIERRLAP